MIHVSVLYRIRSFSHAILTHSSYVLLSHVILEILIFDRSFKIIYIIFTHYFFLCVSFGHDLLIFSGHFNTICLFSHAIHFSGHFCDARFRDVFIFTCNFTHWIFFTCIYFQTWFIFIHDVTDHIVMRSHVYLSSLTSIIMGEKHMIVYEMYVLFFSPGRNVSVRYCAGWQSSEEHFQISRYESWKMCHGQSNFL